MSPWNQKWLRISLDRSSVNHRNHQRRQWQYDRFSPTHRHRVYRSVSLDLQQPSPLHRNLRRHRSQHRLQHNRRRGGQLRLCSQRHQCPRRHPWQQPSRLQLKPPRPLRHRQRHYSVKDNGSLSCQTQPLHVRRWCSSRMPQAQSRDQPSRQEPLSQFLTAICLTLDGCTTFGAITEPRGGWKKTSCG